MFAILGYILTATTAVLALPAPPNQLSRRTFTREVNRGPANFFNQDRYRVSIRREEQTPRPVVEETKVPEPAVEISLRSQPVDVPSLQHSVPAYSPALLKETPAVNPPVTVKEVVPPTSRPLLLKELVAPISPSVVLKEGTAPINQLGLLKDVSPHAKITKQNTDLSPDGSFYNVWETENGIQFQEQANLKDLGDKVVPVVSGQYSYYDNDGRQYYVRYIADENGFQPSGEHLPTPPPLPESVARALDYIATHPAYVEPTESKLKVIVN